ncbi:MAG TPA: PhoU domain-containing protein [Candidatus Baltobacteraceae bacterium]|jgi:phosphate transport system protein
MLRVAYHEALEGAEVDLGTLGALMVDALHHAVRAVETSDAALSARIITGADQTAELGRRIESACIDLIWRQQPLADELRRVTGMFEISTDLQRINYYIVDIAKHAVRLAEKTPAGAPREALREVAKLTEDDLKSAVEGYSKRDLSSVRKVLEADEHYEKLYSSGIRNLQNAIRANTDVLAAATELLFVLTSLQRVGEHASSIAWHTAEMFEADGQA